MKLWRGRPSAAPLIMYVPAGTLKLLYPAGIVMTFPGMSVPAGTLKLLYPAGGVMT